MMEKKMSIYVSLHYGMDVTETSLLIVQPSIILHPLIATDIPIIQRDN